MGEAVPFIAQMPHAAHLIIDSVRNETGDVDHWPDREARVLRRPRQILAIAKPSELRELVKIEAIRTVVDGFTTPEPD